MASRDAYPDRDRSTAESRSTSPSGSDVGSDMKKAADQAQEKARQAADQTQEQVRQMADQAQQRARPMTDQAQQKASQMADQAQHRAASMLENQKQKAAENLHSVAEAMRQSGQQLREQDQAQMAVQYTDKAAEQIEHFANYLRSKDVNELMNDAERFARRQPELFLGGAFALGLLAARFLKSSSQQTAQRGAYQQAYERERYGPRPRVVANQEMASPEYYERRPSPPPGHAPGTTGTLGEERYGSSRDFGPPPPRRGIDAES